VSRAHFLGLAPLSSNVSLTPASETVLADQQTVRETRRRSQAGVVAAGPCESCACCACPFSHPSLLPHIFSPCLQDAWRRVFDHTPRSSSALRTGRVAANLQRSFTSNLIIWCSGMRGVLPTPPLLPPLLLLQYQVPCLRPRQLSQRHSTSQCPQLFLLFHHSW
jgi:hypothetical protein